MTAARESPHVNVSTKYTYNVSRGAASDFDHPRLAATNDDVSTSCRLFFRTDFLPRPAAFGAKVPGSILRAQVGAMAAEFEWDEEAVRNALGKVLPSLGADATILGARAGVARVLGVEDVALKAHKAAFKALVAAELSAQAEAPSQSQGFSQGMSQGFDATQSVDAMGGPGPHAAEGTGSVDNSESSSSDSSDSESMASPASRKRTGKRGGRTATKRGAGRSRKQAAGRRAAPKKRKVADSAEDTAPMDDPLLESSSDGESVGEPAALLPAPVATKGRAKRAGRKAPAANRRKKKTLKSKGPTIAALSSSSDSEDAIMPAIAATKAVAVSSSSSSSSSSDDMDSDDSYGAIAKQRTAKTKKGQSASKRARPSGTPLARRTGSGGKRVRGPRGVAPHLKRRVDPSCTLKADHHVLPHGDLECSAILTRPDASLNEAGQGKFYLLQALAADTGAGPWFVWARWGNRRIPGRERSKLWTFGTADEARDKFIVLYSAKTGNNFGDVFQPAPGKYVLDVEAAERAEEEAVAAEAAARVEAESKSHAEAAASGEAVSSGDPAAADVTVEDGGHEGNEVDTQAKETGEVAPKSVDGASSTASPSLAATQPVEEAAVKAVDDSTAPAEAGRVGVSRPEERPSVPISSEAPVASETLLDERLLGVVEAAFYPPDLGAAIRMLGGSAGDDDERPDIELLATASSRLPKAYSALRALDAARALGDESKQKEAIDLLAESMPLGIPGVSGSRADVSDEDIAEVTRKLRIVAQASEGAKLLQRARQASSLAPQTLPDALYASLRCRLTPLGDDSEVKSGITTAVASTMTSAQRAQFSLIVQQVFEARRAGERERFAPFRLLPNRRLLWQAVPVALLPQVLRRGAQLLPMDAPTTGQIMGRGAVFFELAGCAAASAGISRDAPEVALLLFEVACGLEQRLEFGADVGESGPAAPYHSVVRPGGIEGPAECEKPLLPRDADLLLQWGPAGHKEGVPPGFEECPRRTAVFDVAQARLRWLAIARTPMRFKPK